MRHPLGLNRLLGGFLLGSGTLFRSAVIAAAALVTATLAGLIPALHTLRLRIPEAIAYE